MVNIRWKAGLFVSALSVICIFIWLISNLVVALLVLTLGLLFYLANHIFWLDQLNTWLHSPDLKNVPEGSSLWEDVFNTLLKYERSNTLKRAELTAAVERFEIVANAIPDGLIILSTSNEILWCTSLAEKQLGLDIRTDQHLPIVNLVRNSHFIAYLYSNLYDEPFKLKDYRRPETLLEIWLIPLANQQKLLICRDITQLEKVDAMRRDFIANVSHELRTPLTVVGGFIETLTDMEGAIPKNILGYFSMMQEQTTRMRRLIDDLLTLSHIESNSHPPEDGPIEMRSLMNIVLSDAKALSNGRHAIDADTAEGLDLSGALDELQSALSNLVSNAVRYTPEGGKIRISWHLQGKQAIFSVTDNGIGIAQQHIDRLTERFYRVDRSRSRETGGTGLGLAIVKHILTRHQAKLEIHSELGKGSIFSVIFPAERILKRQHSN